ncbi:TPA: XRE family transcriptional regulator [Escherichia coli]|nr:XRE family transcriptional regulator [Escherichia coli]HAV8149324.1 XRE family transcriptional regulator [Escherichia coli]HAV9669037.1 XRE family transcriptional regulator [Escherichia coli]HAW0087290.1 XRE family transcriptional regulator [Escherichia coli]HAW0395365.1 XRE family transcriptional regulator [Escherichia coli]
MNKQATTSLSFPGGRKESIAERLKRLIGPRSVRAAARDWGLSFSTLNNYLSRGTEPSLSVALQIASIEGVSVEWLCGFSDVAQVNHSEIRANQDESKKIIMTIISALDEKDLEQLSKNLVLNGAKYLARLLEPENQDLIRLEGRKRIAALQLEGMSDERVREILEETERSRKSNAVDSKAG